MCLLARRSIRSGHLVPTARRHAVPGGHTPGVSMSIINPVDRMKPLSLACHSSISRLPKQPSGWLTDVARLSVYCKGHQSNDCLR